MYTYYENSPAACYLIVENVSNVTFDRSQIEFSVPFTANSPEIIFSVTVHSYVLSNKTH